MDTPHGSFSVTSSTKSSQNGEDNYLSATDLFGKSPFQSKSRWNPLQEDSDTMQGLNVLGVDDQSVTPEELPIDELERCIQVMIQSNVSVRTENNLLESYLTDVDPLLIENMDKILEAATAAIHKAERTAQLATTLTQQGSRTDHESSSSSPRSTGPSLGGSSKIGGLTGMDKGARVQPSQKIEIAQREVDKLKAGYEELQKRAEKTIFNLECQMEETEIRLKELEEKKKEFNTSLLKEWPDPATSVIPGEKLINYFEMRNKLDHSFIKGFPTKSKNMKIQLDACTTKIREIGEGLLYVDYEQLLIHYDTVRNNLANTLVKLTNHKKSNTTCVLMLTLTRDIIMKEESEKEKMRKDAMKLEKELNRLLKNEEKTLAEMNRTNENIRKLEMEIGKYTAPPVFQYIKHKAQLQEMKKNFQALQRKRIHSLEPKNYGKGCQSTHPHSSIQAKDNKDSNKKQRPRLYTGSAFWNPSESRNRRFNEE